MARTIVKDKCDYILFFFRTKRINHKMKPCLVQKPSTSDEEIQSNENQPILSLSNRGRVIEQPPHGILKVPSGEN